MIGNRIFKFFYNEQLKLSISFLQFKSNSFKETHTPCDALIYCEKMFVIPITSTNDGAKNTTKCITTFLYIFCRFVPACLIPYTDVIHDILFSDDPTAQHTLSNITSQNCCLSKYHLCERYALMGVRENDRGI